jgi:hypothetical protein
VIQEQQAQQDLRVQREFKVFKELQDPKAILVIREQQEQLDLKVFKEILEQQVLRVQLEDREILDLPDLREFRD